MYEILPLVMIVAVFYFLVMRPMQRQRKQVAELQASLQVGDRVMLSSGIYGTLSELTDTTAKVFVAPGVELEVIRGAIGAVDSTSLQQHADLDELPAGEDK